MPDPPVVLVHGFGGSFATTWQGPGWDALLVDAGRRVIGVDLLGHGSAPRPHDPAAYVDLGARVRAALPAEGKVDAIGFSLGARTLLEVATSLPERFERLVVAGVGDNLFQDVDVEPVARAVEGGGDAGDPQLARLFAQYAGAPGNDPAALAACLRRPVGPLDPAALAVVTCPVLVVLGERDFAGPAGPLVAALPDARLVTLPRVDHFATPEAFGFIDAALGFLGAVPA
ncbi:MAG: alpha/beta fold hydrolase [Acidimicrobiales bacterium]|nr:alpha/beta fold hydrolase [Acidimicrobiales bacterium]